MITQEGIREALRGVKDPEIGRPIEDIGMLQAIEVDGGAVTVRVLITIEGCCAQPSSRCWLGPSVMPDGPQLPTLNTVSTIPVTGLNTATPLCVASPLSSGTEI